MTTEAQKWMNRDGALLDGGSNPDSKMFAFLANGKYINQTAYISNNITRILNDESWWSGNKGAALIAMQTYFWFKQNIPTADADRIYAALINLPGDDYFWSTHWNNGSINIMVVRYVMSQYARSATCKYGWADNESRPEDFTWQGRSYKVGQRYNTFQLCSDWLMEWMNRYYHSEYFEGELFSETYSYHFINGLITLADSRMVFDTAMRNAAAKCADFFLFEHGVNTNKSHLAAPLGRTYMNQHLTGVYMFFPFEPYFGFMPEVHYGTAGSWYISEYNLNSKLRNFVNSLSKFELKSNVQGGRYVYAHPKFTLGSNPNGGNWMLQIVSNDMGATPKARLGQPFRFWMNNNPNDLNEASCSGECYSEMGQSGHQYKDTLITTLGQCMVHNPMIKTNWDDLRKSGVWNFGLENGVAVAWQIGVDSAALEIGIIGEDSNSFDDFMASVKARSSLNGYVYTNRRGERISKNGSDQTTLNGGILYSNLPRLEVYANNAVYTFESLLDLPPTKIVPTPPTGIHIVD